MKTALLAGGTGLIGSQLLSLLLESDRYSTVKVISRRPLDVKHYKLENLVIDFNKLMDYGEHFGAHDVFCCLGTTMKKAGSQEAFRKVDFDYSLEIARLTKAMGARQYMLVSALGANKNSAVYYNRIKGELESFVRSVGFETLHIFRPWLLTGPRKEQRMAEDALKIFYNIFGFIVPERYKAIDSMKVARAMLHYAASDRKGIHIHESGTLQQF